MGGWRSLLDAMVADPDPRSYTYDEAAGVLANLGFAQTRRGGGSHRIFRLEIADSAAPNGRRPVIIGLLDAGKGKLAPIYIKKMIRELHANNLLPDRVS
jgi:predicted RNA binding protein YcfA (HicA-like mRNA interferase family)